MPDYPPNDSVTASQRRILALNQSLQYLSIAKKKHEEGDTEGENYWRERTSERLSQALAILPALSDDLSNLL